jgi:hypothetical protein
MATTPKTVIQKGSEPENIVYSVFNGDKRLFVNSERANVVFVFDMTNFTNPSFVQILPSGKGPEGGLAIPSRNLYVVASEVDGRAIKLRSSLTIYEGGFFTHPTNFRICQSCRWYSNSMECHVCGLAAEIRGLAVTLQTSSTLLDSYYKKSRLFHIDTSTSPAKVTKEYRLQDTAKSWKGFLSGQHL